jgi:hypothetical protein
MAIFGLLFLIACLIVIGIGIVVGVLAAIALAVLIGLGIVSSSAAVGFGKKSVAAGFLTLALEVGACLGILGGAMVGFVAALFVNPTGPSLMAIAAGSAGGLVAGVTVGWLFHFSARRVLRWLRDHVEVGVPTAKV